MLLQLDGSHHLWLEDRGPWLTLLLAVGRRYRDGNPMHYSRNRRIPEATCPCSRASLNVGGCRWRCTPMGMPSFSHGVVHRDLSQVPGKGPSTQWSRALGETGDHPDIGPTVPRPKEGWSEPTAPSRTGLVAELRLGWRLHPGGGESSAGQVSASVQPALRGACGPGGGRPTGQ